MSLEEKNFTDAEARAQALAAAVADNIKALLARQEKVVLAVSGGSTPKLFFDALSQTALDWANVVLMLVDERCVFETHEDSNMRLLKTHLHKNKASAAAILNYLDVSAIYDIGVLEKYANNRFVQPDIVVLGMGGDGHTASIFPKALAFKKAVTAAPGFVVVVPPQAPHMRISLTLSAILAAKFRYLEIGGEEKRSMLAKATQAQNPLYPISYVIAGEGTLDAYLS